MNLALPPLRTYWPRSVAGKAYAAGVAAFHLGRGCPFGPERCERRYWREGFADARRQARAFRLALRQIVAGP